MTDELPLDDGTFGIRDGETCPQCGTDISIVGNGCNVEHIEDYTLVEVQRRCYSCGNEWTVYTNPDYTPESTDTTTDDHETERVEKTLIGLPSAQTLGNFEDEIALAAVDSAPKLDQRTVRIESVDRLESGNYKIVISGEKMHSNDECGD